MIGRLFLLAYWSYIGRISVKTYVNTCIFLKKSLTLKPLQKGAFSFDIP